MAKPYTFTQRADGSYRCESAVAGEGACLVRQNGKVWETAPIPQGFNPPKWSACPVANASFTRRDAVMAFFYYHRS